MLHALPQLCAICLFLLFMTPSIATAAPYHAPSHWFFNARTQLVVGTVSDFVDGRVQLVDVETLHGRDPLPIPMQIHLPVWAAQSLQKGTRYVLAYSIFTGNNMQKGQYLIDTRGPQILQGDGMSPAIYRADPQLLAWIGVDAKRAAKQLLPIVMSGLASQDGQLQDLYAAELRFAKGMTALLGPQERVRLRGYLRDPNFHPSARAHLLQVLADDSDAEIKASVGAILRTARGAGYVGESPNESTLLSFALDLATRRKLALDPHDLTRMVAADSAIISEWALFNLRLSGGSAEQDALHSVLAQTLLAPDTRAFLLDHQRRTAASNQSPSIKRETP